MLVLSRLTQPPLSGIWGVTILIRSKHTAGGCYAAEANAYQETSERSHEMSFGPGVDQGITYATTHKGS